ncbi:DMT family transporter [candidate division WOR-3 bacterium]|nr:DMT family transporter [candidate division WOR-3 bacterium]
MSSSTPFLGEALSLLTAAIWAFAVILFKKSGETVHPLALNLFKNLLAIGLLLPTLWFSGQTLLLQTSANAYIILFLSGAIGIGIGDTLFFKSLNELGAGLTGIVVCMYSPFIIVFSYFLLNESLTNLQLMGALLIIIAVLTSTIQRKPENVAKKNVIYGVTYGILASAAMAVGVVIMKPLLDTYSVIWVAEIRLLGGLVTLLLILLCHPRRRGIMNSLLKTHNWHYVMGGSFFGAYLAMIVWIAGIKYTQASIASALNETSTIFIFIFAGLILKEPMNLRRTIGIVLAFIGAFLVLFF